MPSKCSFEGCDKKGSLQGKLPGTEKVAYFCCGSHMESSGATQTEKNKKQRKDCNAKMLLNRKRKQENGGEAGKRHMLLILSCGDTTAPCRASQDAAGTLCAPPERARATSQIACGVAAAYQT